MKNINSIKFLFAIATVFSLVSCDKGFVEKNQSPYALITMEPGILLSSAQRRVSAGSWEVEATIVQQFVNAYNAGATVGYQFNGLFGAETYNQTRWNQMYNAPDGAVRLLDRAIALAKGDPAKANLLQMLRILRAMNYMILVDTYGDVPYTEANLAYTGTAASITTPKYDKGADIYTDLYKELKEARAALTTTASATNTGVAVNTDIFYGTSLTATDKTVQIPKWQRLAGSLMLRLGMRYSKLNTTTAQTIVADAVSGPGVMTSTADDAYVPFNSTDQNPLNAGPRGTNPFNYYLYEPFVNQLKNTGDPRGKYIAAYYSNPNSIGGAPQDTVLANQFGFPVGYDNATIVSKPDYKGPATGANSSGFRYTQLNYNVFGSNTAPLFVATFAQTQLLLAEARLRGWISTGSVVGYYEAGIRASMDEYRLYPNAMAIPDLNYQSYKRQPAVALTGVFASDLAKINTQYWIVSLGNTAETFANFRRTGLPALTPNPYGTPLPASTGGFARRVPYPSIERSANAANYAAAVASIGGTDDVTRRVFWDIP